MKLSLRESIEPDLEIFFLNHIDEEANFMAAFTPKNPQDKTAYLSKWKKLLADDSVNMQTVLTDEIVIGFVVKFLIDGTSEISYSIDKKYWGKGLTTEAVKIFLTEEKTRPIRARVAFDNIASQRVLEKTGFKRIGKDRGFANARGKEIEEFIYKL